MSTGSNEIAIKVEGIRKSFKLPHEDHSGIKQVILNLLNRKRKSGYEIQKVLDGIDFEIKKGEFFGIVGRNGSGKSTLLKLLAGIYSPDTGRIDVNGSLTPFIELGVGFNPELTGRENVFLNGALLGFNRDEMGRMYDDIVEFAELDRFMDQKLKNYSSGMQVRLAFSVAIRARSDILVLDEVLAVGDANFQNKCNDYFEQQKAKGQTIILVTHDMSNVQKFCTKAMLLDKGEILTIGDPEVVALEYERLNKDTSLEASALAEEKVLHGVTVSLSSNGEKIKKVKPGDEIDVDISWKDDQTKNVGIAFFKRSGERIFATNTRKEKVTVTDKKVRYSITADVAPGEYFFRIRLYGDTEETTTALIEVGPEVTVESPDGHTVDGVLDLQHSWK